VDKVDTQPARGGRIWLLSLMSAVLPTAAWAQASPFDTGANSLVTFALTIATPIAVLIVIGLAIAAAVGKISWGWVIGALVGIAAIFGAPQIVAWIRALFGV
jgi:type IV secretory pathway VirB2 component (pilin)